VVLLAVAEALVEEADAVMKVVGVAELDSLVLEGADEGDTEDEEADEGEAELATSASTTAALPLAEEDEEEESFPTPALVLRAVTSSAEVAFHTESAEPIASTAAVSVNEPKSPEPDRELIWQSRPRAAEHEAASPAVGTLKRPLVSLRVAAETGALQSWKTLPSMRILAPASTSKLWL
jgi:hypothetical protein